MGDKTTVSKAERSEAKKRIRRAWRLSRLRHILAVIGTLFLAFIVLLVILLNSFFRGPSQAASDFGVQTLHQSSALKFIPYLFLFEHVQEALDRADVTAADEVTYTSIINIAADTDREGAAKKAEAGDYYAPGYVADGTESSALQTAEQEEFDENGIRLVEVTGPTYHGYMMIVKDPSRVILGTCSTRFSTEKSGKRVDEIMADYGAIAVMNGGAFSDSNGSGNGGQAEGLVYSEGKLMNHANNHYKVAAGFDANNILHVGEFTDAKAKELGLRDACAFGPALVINGVPSVSNDKGLNPRSAIGQRADGAVLLLVIDGRQANSLGATIADVINVMVDFGAVNACNMDGGSSTIMYYGEEKINDGMTISVSRRMPTAWIVR